MLGKIDKEEGVPLADEQEKEELRAFADTISALSSEQRGALLRAYGHEKTGRRKPAPG